MNKIVRYMRAKRDPAMALVLEVDRIEAALESRLMSKLSDTVFKSIRGVDAINPVKGKDYFTPQEIAQVIAYIESRIRIPKDGVGHPGKNGRDADEQAIIEAVIKAIRVPEDGKTPIPGIDYPTNAQIQALVYTEIAALFALKPKGKDGITKEEVDQLVGKIQQKIDFAEHAKEIARALETLKGTHRLDYNSLKNTPTTSGARTHTLHRGGGATGTVSSPMYYDLSSLTDGATKIFTIPTNTRVVWVGGTDVPGGQYRQTTDYTGSGTTTLTLTSEVVAPSQGATLHLIYV
jgi:hypothetical protein